MKEVFRLAAKAAGLDTSVLITGETGSGKRLLAKLIHDLSPRRDEPWIEVPCAAIPASQVESKLFGHEKGGFPGAAAHRAGILERAGGGTIFLDEIGELPPPVQLRLLRVLETRSFERVGGSETLGCDARVIVATNATSRVASSRGASALTCTNAWTSSPSMSRLCASGGRPT